MADTKKVYSRTDAQPVVLYAKQDGDKEQAYPIIANTSGNLEVSIVGLVKEAYDYVSVNTPALPTIITFKTGGVSGPTVATLTVVYSGSYISIITRI